MSDLNDELITLPRQLSLAEFDKLQSYLLAHGYNVDIVHRSRQMLGRMLVRMLVQSEHHQLIVYDTKDANLRLWDAVISDYSYGHEDGLLEAMGSLLGDRPGDVEGWLTADDIIRRLEEPA